MTPCKLLKIKCHITPPSYFYRPFNILTISDRPRVITEADSESMEQVGHMGSHRTSSYLQGQFCNACTSCLAYCMIVRFCCFNIVGNLHWKPHYKFIHLLGLFIKVTYITEFDKVWTWHWIVQTNRHFYFSIYLYPIISMVIFAYNTYKGIQHFFLWPHHWINVFLHQGFTLWPSDLTPSFLWVEPHSFSDIIPGKLYQKLLFIHDTSKRGTIAGIL